MLTKKQAARYKKQIIQKLKSAGIEDVTTMKISKTVQFRNPHYKPVADGGSPDQTANPEFLLVHSQQASRMIRQIYKKLLSTDARTIEAFLATDISQVKPAPPPPSPTKMPVITKQMMEDFKRGLELNEPEVSSDVTSTAAGEP